MAPCLAQFKHHPVGVLGLGCSGLSAVRTLKAHGSKPIVFDDDDTAIKKALGAGGHAGEPADVADLAALIVSPGVPLYLPKPHRIVQTANENGVRLLSDLDLFFELCGGRQIIGVTGTNGKSTTSALIAHLIRQAGRPAALGGNIGVPVLDLELGTKDQIIVLELSSFQLDLIATLRCNVAVWLNIAADHLDRHGDLQSYVAAKKRIFDRQTDQDLAIVCIDDDVSAQVAADLRMNGKKLFSASGDARSAANVQVRDGWLIDATRGQPRSVFDLATLKHLPGRHNRQNAAVAYASLRALGFEPEAIAAGLTSFQGLSHRSEFVGECGNLRFINDSKATNPAAAMSSLTAYDNIFWLAGGRPKPGGFLELSNHLSAVTRGYFFGEAGRQMKREIGGSINAVTFATLREALDASIADANRADNESATILLAPACASFDQFANFETRGDAFRDLVQQKIDERVA